MSEQQDLSEAEPSDLLDSFWAAPAPRPRKLGRPGVDYALEGCKALLALWKSKNATQVGFPSANDFDPLELRPWVDNLLKVAVARSVDGKTRYRVLSQGRNLTGPLGGDWTGQPLPENASARDGIELSELLKTTLRSKGPREKRTVSVAPDGVRIRTNQLALPISDDGKKPTQIFLLIYAEPEER